MLIHVKTTKLMKNKFWDNFNCISSIFASIYLFLVLVIFHILNYFNISFSSPTLLFFFLPHSLVQNILKVVKRSTMLIHIAATTATFNNEMPKNYLFFIFTFLFVLIINKLLSIQESLIYTVKQFRPLCNK